MDADTVEQIRRLRNGLARSLVALIACIVVTSVAALIAISRRPEQGTVFITLGGVVDFAAIVAAVAVNARVARRFAQLTATAHADDTSGS